MITVSPPSPPYHAATYLLSPHFRKQAKKKEKYEKHRHVGKKNTNSEIKIDKKKTSNIKKKIPNKAI